MIGRWLLSFAIVALLALAGLLTLVVGTEQGSAWIAGEVELLTDGAVRLQGVQGSLARGLRADELRIAAGTTSIRGENVTVRIRLRDLLFGRLDVRSLGADRVEVTLAGEASTEPFRMPTVSTPIPLEFRKLVINRLEIRRRESLQAVTGIRLAGTMRDSRVSVRELSGTLGALSARLAGTADLVPELPLDAVVQWRVTDPGLSGAGTLRGTLAALDVRQSLRVPDPVDLAGTLTDVANAPRIDATASWESLAIEVPGIGATRASGGRATLEGTPGEWRASLAAGLQAEAWPQMRVRGAAHGGTEHIVFDDIRLDGDFGAVAATGTLDIAEKTRLELAINATDVDIAAFRPGLEGRVSARAALGATVPGEVRLAVTGLKGRLMDRPLAGSGDIAYRDGNLSFAKVDLSAGPNRLRADGTLGERLAGTFALDAPQLSVLWPGLAGRISAHAKVAGTRARPVIDLDAEGAGLVLGDNRLRSVELRGRVDQRMRVDARLQARGIGAGDGRLGDLGNLDATLEGTLEAHRFAGEFSGGPLEARLVSEGSWNGTTLRHRLASASVTEASAGAWRLEGEPELTLRSGAAAIGAHCWVQAPASLCFSLLSWSPGRTQVNGELRDLDLEVLKPFVAQDVAVTGHARATLSLDVTEAGIAGSATSQLDDATVYYTGGDEPLVLPLSMARLDASFTAAQASATLQVEGEGGLRLAGSGTLQAPLGAEAPLDATLVGELPDIAPLLPLLAPDLDLAEVAGRITLDGAVAGTLLAPQFTGVLRFSGGAAALPDLGVKLEAIDVALLGDGSPVLRLEGSATVGGLLTMRGEVTPLAEGGPSARVRLRGNRIYAVRLPDRLVQASPDVTLRYAGGVLTTEGSVTIPKADILIRALPDTAASPSPDAVVRDREARAQAEEGQVIRGEIALVLGRDVRLKAFGLDTLLEGTVSLSQGEEREPQGFGVVRLKEGKFGAYGKELTIERGTLGFAGPLDDPAVDLRASRSVDWEGKRVTAGIVLTGTTSRPESRVFSDPAMSEADALSYLISGRPMGSTNSTDRSSIAGAALALGVQQTSPLTQKLGSAVTLDELGVEGGTLDETEVVAGKQIGSDLYVRFTYGLFNRIGTVLARYKVGRHVSIEAASGEDQSLDLIYSIERE